MVVVPARGYRTRLIDLPSDFTYERPPVKYQAAFLILSLGQPRFWNYLFFYVVNFLCESPDSLTILPGA
jgi:hypothetical protein